ncbi:MAG: SAM-dependent methyltransferase [Bdellovibrio sp.]|nr:MAG: SAM-dependent methyltransferase [Bdellovibrio sp.]
MFPHMRPFHLPEHLLIKESLASPAIFSQNRPVDLEIGCGVGFHSIQRAKKYPGRNLIAIEHTRIRFQRFAHRVSRHPPMPNLFPVHAHAVSWITKNVPRRSLSEVFLLYPNPNPQNRSQRWFLMPFWQRLIECLKPGGLVHLATNSPDYAREAEKAARELWSLECVFFRTLPSAWNTDFEPRTHFEKKYLRRGETCFDLQFLNPNGERGRRSRHGGVKRVPKPASIHRANL